MKEVAWRIACLGGTPGRCAFASGVRSMYMGRFHTSIRQFTRISTDMPIEDY